MRRSSLIGTSGRLLRAFGAANATPGREHRHQASPSRRPPAKTAVQLAVRERLRGAELALCLICAMLFKGMQPAEGDATLALGVRLGAVLTQPLARDNQSQGQVRVQERTDVAYLNKLVAHHVR